MTRIERGDEAAHIEKLHALLVSPPSPQDIDAVREFVSNSKGFFAATLNDPQLMHWINSYKNLINERVNSLRRAARDKPKAPASSA